MRLWWVTGSDDWLVSLKAMGLDVGTVHWMDTSMEFAWDVTRDESSDATMVRPLVSWLVVEGTPLVSWWVLEGMSPTSLCFAFRLFQPSLLFYSPQSTHHLEASFGGRLFRGGPRNRE